MQLQPGALVANRFRLVRIIARGAMGSVWEATHLALDQPCAVKFISGQLAHIGSTRERFEREAKAAAQLRSPHVVQILDHGVWNQRPYIAMELLEGEDLGHALRRERKLPVAQVNNIIQQVCRALTKAHQAGIIHRDLKPDNIFLVNDDDRELVKVLDFGIAKSTFDFSNTKTGSMLGTPFYMSPEQVKDTRQVDARSDLWCLAVIVYQCVTGRLPFESDSMADLLVKIMMSPLPVPSRVAEVPPGFDRWWARAAERDPNNRFPTAKEFAGALAIALNVTDSAMRSTQRYSSPPAAILDDNARTARLIPPTSTDALVPQTLVMAPTSPTSPALPTSTVATATVAIKAPAVQVKPLQVSNGGLGPVVSPAAHTTSKPPPPPTSNQPLVVVGALGTAILVLAGLIGGGVLVARRGAALEVPAPPASLATTTASATSTQTAAASSSSVAASADTPSPNPATLPSTETANAATATSAAAVPSAAVRPAVGRATPPTASHAVAAASIASTSEKIPPKPPPTTSSTTQAAMEQDRRW